MPIIILLLLIIIKSICLKIIDLDRDLEMKLFYFTVLFWRDFARNCGIWDCFCIFLVINYIIMGKNQYYEWLLSPWCIKYFFTDLFLFFFVHFALFRRKQRPRNGMEILLTSKIIFFWYLNNIKLSLSNFFQLLLIEKSSKILGSNGPRTG